LSDARLTAMLFGFRDTLGENYRCAESKTPPMATTIPDLARGWQISATISSPICPPCKYRLHATCRI